MNDKNAAVAVAILAGGLAFAACARQQQALPAGVEPAPASMEALGIQFNPPSGWIAMDEGTMATAREASGAKKQVGPFNAVVEAAFAGPSGEYMIFSGLSPNQEYSPDKGTYSQLGDYAQIISGLFSSEGEFPIQPLKIGAYRVLRISGFSAGDFVGKFLFLDAKETRPFAVDVLIPAATYSTATADSVANSLLTIR